MTYRFLCQNCANNTFKLKGKEGGCFTHMNILCARCGLEFSLNDKDHRILQAGRRHHPGFVSVWRKGRFPEIQNPVRKNRHVQSGLENRPAGQEGLEKTPDRMTSSVVPLRPLRLCS